MDLMTESADTGDHPFKEPVLRDSCAPQHTRILPVFGLNELYIGESLSSRVSYLELQMDKEPAFKSRNSGLCISTGTGSTSWTFNINKLTHHAVESLLKIIYETTKYSLNWKVITNNGLLSMCIFLSLLAKKSNMKDLCFRSYGL